MYVSIALVALLSPAQLPAKLSADAAAVATDNNLFACDLYSQLARADGNLFFSPYSISNALAMTYAGARGKTAEQMAKVLHFDLVPAKLHTAWGELIRALNDPGPKRGYQLNVANALWGQKGYGFQPEFLKLTRENYNGGLHELDFTADIEKARQTINAWVEKQTRDKIKDLIQQGDMSPDTRLVLTNAIYFKAGWLEAFSDKLTRQEEFRTAADKKIKVPMMHVQRTLRYLQGDGFQMVELPYEGRELALVVFLPSKVDGLGGFEKTLNAARVNDWLKRSSAHAVSLALPRFKITASFKLKSPLLAMGMTEPFSGKANFSGMTTREALAIGQVLHKAFVDVNEQGTEAAAATAVIMAPTGFRPLTPVTFTADHPFVFLIRENRTGSILFMGRLSNP